MDFILSIISSATVSGLLAAVLIWLSRNWLSERLKKSIEHEYAQKLAAHKAVLKAESDVALERLRASIAQNQAMQSVATSTFTAINIASHERRIKAIEAFWTSIVNIRNGTPGVLTILDIIIPDEYPTLLTNPNSRASIDELSMENIISRMHDVSAEADIIRPFIGEYLYALFFAYRALISRISYIVMEGRDKGHISTWFADKGIRQLIATVMNNEEIEKFDNIAISKISYMRDLIEQKMLRHISKIITGESDSELSLEQARKIAEAASKLESSKRGT